MNFNWTVCHVFMLFVLLSWEIIHCTTYALHIVHHPIRGIFITNQFIWLHGKWNGMYQKTYAQFLYCHLLFVHQVDHAHDVNTPDLNVLFELGNARIVDKSSTIVSPIWVSFNCQTCHPVTYFIDFVCILYNIMRKFNVILIFFLVILSLQFHFGVKIHFYCISKDLHM